MGAARRLEQVYLITVRLWLEDAEGERAEWRGRVRSEVDGETHYFRTWEALMNYLQGMLPEHLPGVAGPAADRAHHSR